jgi:hypothetical protein
MRCLGGWRVEREYGITVARAEGASQTIQNVRAWQIRADVITADVQDAARAEFTGKRYAAADERPRRRENG